MKRYKKEKGVRRNCELLLGCRQSRHLSRNQDFDLLRQRNKQTSSISLKALKLAVFLVGSEFRLRIPFGKRICFPNPSAASKLLCLQSERSQGLLFLRHDIGQKSEYNKDCENSDNRRGKESFPIGAAVFIQQQKLLSGRVCLQKQIEQHGKPR